MARLTAGRHARISAPGARRTAALGRARRGDASQLRGHRRPFAADGSDQSAGLSASSRPAALVCGGGGDAQLASVHRQSGARARDAGSGRDRGHPPRPSVLDAERQEICRCGARGHASRHALRLRALVLRSSPAARRFCCQGPRSGARGRRSRGLHGSQPAGCRDRERRSIRTARRENGRRRGGPVRTHAVDRGLSERGSHKGAVARSGHFGSHPCAGRRGRGAPSGGSHRLRLRPHRDPVRHRHPGEALGLGMRRQPSAYRVAQRLPLFIRLLADLALRTSANPPARTRDAVDVL